MNLEGLKKGKRVLGTAAAVAGAIAMTSVVAQGQGQREIPKDKIENITSVPMALASDIERLIELGLNDDKNYEELVDMWKNRNPKFEEFKKRLTEKLTPNKENKVPITLSVILERLNKLSKEKYTYNQLNQIRQKNSQEFRKIIEELKLLENKGEYGDTYTSLLGENESNK